VVGDFNAWQSGGELLDDEDHDGIASAWLALPPGEHAYRLLADGVQHLDPYNPLTTFDADGAEASLALVPDCSMPALGVTQVATTAHGSLEVRLRFERAHSRAWLDATSAAAAVDGRSVALAATPETGALVVTAAGLAAGKHWLSVSAADERGAITGELRAPFWIEETPFDWKDAVIYQVVIDRFRRGAEPVGGESDPSAFHGGDLDGVTDAISSGYFSALGVSVLWLSPLYDNPEGVELGRDGFLAQAYHGYWPLSPRSVEPRFGGEAALARLVEAAHGRGMRVLMDAVPNHVHREHPYAQQSPSWVNNADGSCICGKTCDWQSHVDSCWFDPFLPDLRWQTPAVATQLTDDAAFWLEHYDLDGLRIDAVPMMPRAAVRRLRHRLAPLAALGVEPFLLGETFTDATGRAAIRYYLGPHSLSGQFDFPLMWAVRQALAGALGMDALWTAMEDSAAAFSDSGAVMAPILGNHDVPRILSDLAGDGGRDPRRDPPVAPERDEPYDLQKLAWAFLLAQPGAPVIYYGDELGLPGATDPDNRRDMRFAPKISTREASVLATVQRLGRARACDVALRRGEARLLASNDNLLAFGRVDTSGHPAVVVLNRAAKERDLVLHVPAAWPLAEAAAFVDVLGNEVGLSGRDLHLVIGPRRAAVLLSNPTCQERP
jgi:glycosidase